MAPPLFSLSPADGSLRAVCGGVCRGGTAEESNPGGAVPGSCRGPHPAGPGDVHRVGGGDGRIPPRQQDPAAHGRDESTSHVFFFLVFIYSIQSGFSTCAGE